MHIGVDGGCWANRRGYGRFLRELLEAVARTDRTNQYTVILDASSRANFHLNGNFRAVVVDGVDSVDKAATSEGRRSLMDLARMSRTVAREKLDLFFFSSVYSYFPLLPHVPTVLGIHDTIADRNPGFSFSSRRHELFWRAKVRFAISRAQTILTVSQYSKKCLTEVLNIPDSRVRVMYEAAASRFHPMDAGRPERPYVLYVGGISPNKNLPALIRAFHKLKARQRGLELVLVGDYENDGFKGCYRELLDLIGVLNLRNHVRFAGYIPDDELCAMYNRASLFAMPSLDEGFGLPAVEAMACGVPVVVSTGNSLAEVVGDAGLAVDPHDEQALTAAMDRVLGDERFATELSHRSLRRAATFSWDAAATRLLQVFEETRRGARK